MFLPRGTLAPETWGQEPVAPAQQCTSPAPCSWSEVGLRGLTWEAADGADTARGDMAAGTARDLKSKKGGQPPPETS